MMVELLLSEPSLGEERDSDSVRNRINVLKKLESAIWSVIKSEGRSEARLWLCKTISSLSSATPQAQRDIFMKLLRSRPMKMDLVVQLLQVIFEKRTRRVGAIIARKSYLLEKFFKGNPRRILQWFGNFGSVGESGHKNGARALSQFAFVNRDICWEELEWKGKHGQSPAMVATKPHYFLDLDVLHTVENFLENVPEFWSSDELAESVKDGEILLIDTKYFIDCFLDLMYEQDSEEVWEVISEFLRRESFSSLCHHLLLVLDESDLCAFLNSFCKFHSLKMEPECTGHSSYWLELVLYINSGCKSIDELLLLNSVINQGRQLLRLLRDDEYEEERKNISELVLQINTNSSVSEAALVKECLMTKKVDSVKWLGLQSWVVLYQLSEKCKSPESWEALFTRSGINFRRSNSYELLRTDTVLEESTSSFDDEGSTRARRKKGKSRKRRRYYDSDNDGSDESVDRDVAGERQDFQPKSGSWFLESDNYSSKWDSVDLPEHLAKHCFSTWIKWLCSKWSSMT